MVVIVIYDGLREVKLLFVFFLNSKYKYFVIIDY